MSSNPLYGLRKLGTFVQLTGLPGRPVRQPVFAGCTRWLCDRRLWIVTKSALEVYVVHDDALYKLTTFTFNSRLVCRTRIIISSMVMTVTIASAHFACPRRDGQAELLWMAWLNMKIEDGIRVNGHPFHFWLTHLGVPSILRLRYPGCVFFV